MNSLEIKSNINRFLSFESTDCSIGKENQFNGEEEVEGFQALLESKTRLEKEKEEMQRQLIMREKEVSSLARRCQSQDDKAKEACKLKATNNELEGQLVGLKSVLSMQEKEFSQIEKLKKDLEECQVNRDELRVELSKVKKDHDHVVDNLNSCFKNIQRQQEKYQELDDECRRKAQHRELMIEKERMEHVDSVNNLKGELQFSQNRIEQLEKLLRDSMATTADLRRERLELKTSLEEGTKQNEQYNESMNDLKLEHESITHSLKEEYEVKLTKVQSTVTEKDGLIDVLKDDVCTCMDKLMKLSEETENMQNEHSRMQYDYTTSIKELENENGIMIEELAAKDLELAIANTSLEAHKDEKLHLESRLNELEDRVQELEAENAFIMDMEHQLDELNISLFEAQENNSRVEDAFTLTVSEIRTEFESKQKLWSMQEEELQNTISTLRREKSKIEMELQSKLQESRELVVSLGGELDVAKKNFDSLTLQHECLRQNDTVQCGTIAELEGKLEEAQEMVLSKDKESLRLKHQLEQSLAASKRELTTVADKVEYLENQTNDFEEKISSLEIERDTLREELKTKNEELSSIQDKATAIQHTVEDQVEEINALRFQIEDLEESKEEEIHEEKKRNEREICSLKNQFSEEMSCCIDRHQKEIDASRESLQQELSDFNNLMQEKEKLVASLTEKINLERGEKVATIKEMRDESEQLKKRWRTELSQTQDLLQQKRNEVESLRSELVEITGKVEQDAISADRVLNMNNERVSALEQELDDLRRMIQHKSSEIERLNDELQNSKERSKTQVAELYESSATQERRIMSLESDLRQERSACDGKESALKAIGMELENQRQKLLESQRNTLTMEREIKNLRATRDEYLNERDELQIAQVQKVSMLSTELNSKQTMLEKMGCELEMLREEIERKEVEVCNGKKQLSEQGTSLNSLREELKEKEQSLILSQNRVQDLEFSLNHANSQLTKESENLCRIQEKLNDLECEASSSRDILVTQREEASTLREKVLILEKTIEIKTSALNELTTQLESENNKAKIEHDAEEKKRSEMQQIIVSLRSDLQILESESREKEEEIASLNATIKSIGMEKERQIEIAVKKEQSSSIRADELNSAKVELEQKNKSLLKEVTNQNTKISLLNESITNIKNEMATKESQQRTNLTAKDAEIAAVTQELKLIRDNKLLSEAKHQSVIDEKKEVILDMKKRIDQLQTEKEENTKCLQIDIMSLKQKLQKSEINLAISQDEVRDLKMIDLKESEERIAELESTLHKMRVKATSDELSKSAMVSEMQAEIDQLNGKLATIEKSSADAKELHNKTVMKLHSKISTLNGDIETLNLELKDSFKKSNEQHLQITALTGRESELEGVERALQADIENLRLDLKKAHEEQEKTEIILNREIEKLMANRQEEDTEMLRRQTRLEKELQESRSEVSSLLKQQSDIEELLKSRTKLLADMVSHNKETEGKKDSTTRKLADMEKLSEELKHDLELSQMELSEAKSLFSKKEDQLIDAVQKERELREVAEVELEKLSYKVKNWKKDDKELIELEKENSALRDKVRRQEAYLKRKLQKDKVLRERNSKSINATPETRIPTMRKPFSTGGKRENLINLFSGELEDEN